MASLLKVLVVGSGGREHAIVWALRNSSRIGRILVAPGNAGTARLPDVRNVAVKAADVSAIVAAALAEAVDFVVVGPEAPLAAGLVDALAAKGVRAFGPTQAAAEIESSKAFARSLMLRQGVPCARGEVFTDPAAALRYVESQPAPMVVKADGLAAGKGVAVCRTTDEAKDAVRLTMVERAFGEAGDRVVIEECLGGREVSVLALTDGRTIVPLPPACDYKRIGDRDTGPNTGGMGAYSPPGFFGPAELEDVQRRVLDPIVVGLREIGRPYRGVLYAGLMMTANGPKVLEFNARFGDPETQVVLPRLATDLADLILAVLDGTLDERPAVWRPEPCVGVVLASGGYPGKVKLGLPIRGLDRVDPDALAFHAGTRLAEDGAVLTDGGRVLVVAARGPTVAAAREKAYANVERIDFAGRQYRTDIALREIE